MVVLVVVRLSIYLRLLSGGIFSLRFSPSLLHILIAAGVLGGNKERERDWDGDGDGDGGTAMRACVHIHTYIEILCF